MWVVGGSRTGDEMSHAWIAVTHLDQDGYEKIAAEREEKEERSLAGNDWRQVTVEKSLWFFSRSIKKGRLDWLWPAFLFAPIHKEISISQTDS